MATRILESPNDWLLLSLAPVVVPIDQEDVDERSHVGAPGVDQEDLDQEAA